MFEDIFHFAEKTLSHTASVSCHPKISTFTKKGQTQKDKNQNQKAKKRSKSNFPMFLWPPGLDTALGAPSDLGCDGRAAPGEVGRAAAAELATRTETTRKLPGNLEETFGERSFGLFFWENEKTFGKGFGLAWRLKISGVHEDLGVRVCLAGFAALL